MVNFSILFPNGKARQWKVISAEGETKNAEWIFNTCCTIIDEILAVMGPDAVCAGLIMDNTKANQAAMRKLEAHYPGMLCLGCGSHSLSLVIKKWVKKLPWLASLYDTCINISNLSNGVEALKAALFESMRTSYNLVRTICTHVDTRFGSKHFVLRDVQKNYAALQHWAISPEFRKQLDKTDKPANIEAVYDALNSRDSTLVEHGQAAAELIDPPMKVLHEIEGDKPYLSQMLPILTSLYTGTRKWSEKHPELAEPDGNDSGDTANDIAFQRLLGFNYRPCMAAAFLLDPLNFTKTENGFCAPFAEMEGMLSGVNTFAEDAKVCKAAAACHDGSALHCIAIQVHALQTMLNCKTDKPALM